MPSAQFYTPSIGVFGLTLACYSGLVLSFSRAREAGLLKRVRGPPLPTWISMTSWLVAAVATGVAAVVLMFAVAIPVFGVALYPRMLPRRGRDAGARSDLARRDRARRRQPRARGGAGDPVTQLTLLPLAFISGVFYPLTAAPAVIVHIAQVCPCVHLAEAFDACFQPQTAGGWSPSDLAVLAGWGALGVAIASRRFARHGVGWERHRVHSADEAVRPA